MMSDLQKNYHQPFSALFQRFRFKAPNNQEYSISVSGSRLVKILIINVL